MKISIDYYGVRKRIRNTKDVRVAIEYVVGEESRKLGEINIIFTSNANLLQINQEFLKHNYFTDVITFGNSFKNYVAGEIFISVDQVRINADRYKTSPNVELFRVIIHGVLHLIGYSDENEQDKAKMKIKEDHYLKIVESKGLLGADGFTV